jgi:hypothetical protein
MVSIEEFHKRKQRQRGREREREMFFVVDNINAAL